MTAKESLDLIRLLSAIESALLMANVSLPDYLWDQIKETCERIEKELLDNIK